ncbi:MAG: formate--tetrahydrofolate ligase [Myxococcota bacterium]
MRAILDVAHELGLRDDDLSLHGEHMGKLRHATLRRLDTAEARGNVILVTALTPTKYGEGKTTMSIALAQGLARRGRRAVLSLRQPSMGPVFGAKGGGTGGGACTVEPSAQINLHFTGDLHAIAAANNLLAALTDHALHTGHPAAPDPRRVTWKRVLDMNDRALRHVVLGLGGTGDGVPREAAFEITAASEVMALLCLSTSIPDLKRRLGNLVVGFTTKNTPVTARDLHAVGPMAALLGSALLPNLVQTAEGTPALVHGGPFANIAHGCSSVLATRTAARLADHVITEAGFAFDLGGEKFFDIKCRSSGIWPRAVVLVVTVRALRHHGGDSELKLTGAEAVRAVHAGMVNVERHVAGIRRFGFSPVVAINVFNRDSEEELRAVEEACRERGLAVARCEGFARGGAGAEALAEVVEEAVRRPAVSPSFLYPLEASPVEKLRAIATALYGATDVALSDDATRALERLMAAGHGGLPVCVAKTPLSFSDDPDAGGNPGPFTLQVREIHLRAGAGFLLALTGDIQTMPGLPRIPAAEGIDLTDDGEITGVH